MKKDNLALLLLLIFILICNNMKAETLLDIEEIARSMSSISDVYREMKENTVWRSKGFAGTISYDLTVIDSIMIDKFELPQQYEPYLSEQQNYKFEVNLIKAVGNIRVKNYSSFDLYYFAAYYAHKAKLLKSSSENGNSAIQTHDFGRYYHHLLTGLIFDFKKLPLRVSLAPYVNIIHNFDSNSTDIRCDKLIYDATVNLHHSDKYLLDLFLQAFLDNEGFNNINKSNSIRKNEYSAGLSYSLKNLLKCNFTYYRDYRGKDFYKTDIKFIEDLGCSLTLNNDLSINESRWKVIIPYIWVPDDNVFVSLYYEGSYINENDYGGKSWGNGVNICVELHPGVSTDFFDNYRMALWAESRKNISYDLKKTPLLKNKSIFEFTFGIKKKQFTILDWLLK